jgi:hypothetical protein
MRTMLQKSLVGAFVFVAAVLATAPAGAGDPAARIALAASQPDANSPRSRPNTILAQIQIGSSPLKRRDPPPPTIRPQLVSKDPAGSDEIPCIVATRVDPRGDPRATPATCVVEVTDTLLLSYEEFWSSPGQLSAPVTVATTQPDGNVRRVTLNEPTETLYMRPGTPLGRYEFVATAGGRSIRGGFTVKAPAKRILLVSPESNGNIRAGRAVTVHLAGYRPSERVTLYLYRWIDHRDVNTGETIFAYATSIGQTTIDGRGEAALNFPTEPDDPPGSYLVVSSPAQQNNLFSGIFEVTK